MIPIGRAAASIRHRHPCPLPLIGSGRQGDAQYPLVELVIGKDNVVCRDPNNVDTILDLGEYLSVEKLKVLFNNDDVHTSNRDLGDSASKKQVVCRSFVPIPC
jgi:hypothetical protein